MKRLVLICLLIGCGMLAIGATQCGGDTSTTTGTINSADGGNTSGTGTSTSGPSGW